MRDLIRGGQSHTEQELLADAVCVGIAIGFLTGAMLVVTVWVFVANVVAA